MGKKGKKKSIWIVVTFIISIISTIAIGAVSLVYQRNSADRIYKENVEQVLYTVSSIIEDKVTGYERSLDTLIAKGDFTSLSAISKDMKLLTQNDDTILNIYFADTQTGSLTLSIDAEAPANYDSRKSPWYKQVMENPTSLQVTEPYTDEVTGRPTVTLIKGVVKNNKTYGAIGIDIDLTYLKDELSIFKYGETGGIEITNRNGVVVIHNDQSKIGQNEPTNYLIWNDIEANQSGRMKFEHNSVEYDGYYTSYARMGWKILLKNEVSELRAMEKVQIIITLAIIIVTAIMEGAIYNMFSKIKKTRPSKNRANQAPQLTE